MRLGALSGSVVLMDGLGLRDAIGASLLGHLSGGTICPLKREDAMSTKEMEQVELSHELCVTQIRELHNGLSALEVEGVKTKDAMKQLRTHQKDIQKAVFSRVPAVALLINQSVAKGITTSKRVADDSGVSASTVSRYDWIGGTLVEVGISATSKKLAVKSLNLLIKGILRKDDMLNIKDVDSWKAKILDATFKMPSAPKIGNVCDSLMDGAYDTDLDRIVTCIETRRKMLIKA